MDTLTSTSILLVDPSSSRRDQIRTELSDEVGSVVDCSSPPESFADVGDPGCVVSTMVVSLEPIEMYPTSFVRSVQNRWPWVSLILLDGPPSVQMAMGTLRAGAQDYLPQDQSTAEDVAEAVTNSLHRRQPIQTGDSVFVRSISEGKLVGTSDAMQPVFKRLGVASEQSMNVLLRGESGTGKTLTAQAIHAQSTRGGAPVMLVDCRCLTPERARNLFLGTRDAADADAQQAHTLPVLHRDLAGGTVVLEHVDELAEASQSALVHALEAQDFAPDTHQLDDSAGIRFIGTATGPTPSEDLRADLYYRLAELPIALPPLRERSADILPLARHFLQELGESERSTERSFSADAASALRDYPWPGNVRQLENVVTRSAQATSASTLRREDLLLANAPVATGASERSERDPRSPQAPRWEEPVLSDTEAPVGDGESGSTASAPQDRVDGLSFGGGENSIPSLEELKKHAVKEAYEMYDGDVDRASVALDIGRSTMYRMLKRYDLRDNT